MKAKELMIGDWVYSSFCEEPCRVLGIEVYGLTNGYGRVYVEKVEEWKDVFSLTEIPLTPEILEKNGFTYIIVLGEVAPKLENFELDNHWEGDGYSWNGIPLLYVHQLQHALRLCGIEKEIIL